MTFQVNDDDYLERSLVESFRKLKIVDLPKFTPTKAKKEIITKAMPCEIQEVPSIIDKDGNIEINFFSQDFNLNGSPKNIYDKVYRAVNHEIIEFDDDRIYANNDEEEDKEYGELNERNDYPDERKEEENIYYGNKEEDPKDDIIVDRFSSDENNDDSNNNNLNIEENNQIDNNEENSDIDVEDDINMQKYSIKIQTNFDVDIDSDDFDLNGNEDSFNDL
ncbi:hypothetical protein M9Y10_027021 [Tritrichomonas musculus]|uniref:Uncharacterized protein n=1 Tax=Tritrichomonas musculus TaxID=1915356 RepID=A0ABR2H5C2_9EUKA